MKNIAIIPARGGSKRLPNKNLRMLGGIPLIAHSILYAKRNPNIIEAIFVSTDDEEIKACAIEFGAIVIDRPEAISGDFEPTVSAVKHVLGTISGSVDNVILLQPTNPLRPENLLKNAMEEFLSSKRDSLFTVSRNYHKLGKIEDDKFLPFNYTPGQRTQDLEPLYMENGLVYITRSSVIMQDKIISENALPFEVAHPFAKIDIDTAEDLEYAQYIYQKYLTQKNS